MRIGVMMRAMDVDSGFTPMTESLVSNMLTIEPETTLVLIYKTPRFLGRFSQFSNAHEVLAPASSNLVWDQVVVPRVARRHAVDVLFNTKFFAPYVSPCPVTMGLQEPAWFTFPDQYEWIHRTYHRLTLRAFIRRCAHVFPNSRFILEENEQVIGMSIPHATVTYSAAEDRFAPSDDRDTVEAFRREYGLPRRFILCVSRASHYGTNRKGLFGGKAPEIAFRAFREIRGQIPHSLVFAGAKIREYIESCEGSDVDLERVHFLPRVPFDKIHHLYHAAEIFINPCPYEGCPNTVLQAMKASLPMLVADRGGSPDVAEGAALIARSMDSADFAKNLLSLAVDDDLRNEIAQRSLLRAANFSWRMSAQSTLRALHAVVASSRRRQRGTP